MDTLDIDYILSCLPSTKYIFAGVYSKDTLNRFNNNNNKPLLVICNTDNANQIGKHWVLFYFNNNSSVEFFDSLGNTPHSYRKEFLDFMKKFASICMYNETKIQPEGSAICGHYCIAYAYLRCNNYDMHTTLSFLSNPVIVVNFVNKLLRYCISSAVGYKKIKDIQCCVHM